MILRPLEMCGSSMGIFFSEVLEPLPLLWKVPVLVVCALAVLLLLVMLCRYRIKSPLLFAIEPTSSSLARRKKQPKAEPLPYPTTPNQIDHIEGAVDRRPEEGPVKRQPWMCPKCD